MSQKNYYSVLGVSPSENLDGIQEAFRKLAKAYHPDRAGSEGTRRFQDIQEAYSVLCNAERRRAHDDELDENEIRTRSRPEPIVFRRSRPEPLIPRSISILHDFETVRPSFEPLFERFVRNFTGEGVPKGERIEALNVEVALPLDEADRGVVVPLGVPVFHTCRVCGGSGRNWLFPCANCDAHGIIEIEETIRVHIPRGAFDRSTVEIPMDGLGIQNFYLRLHLRISP